MPGKKRTVDSGEKRAARNKVDEGKIEEELQAALSKSASPTESDYLNEYLAMFRKLRRIRRELEAQLLAEKTPRLVYALSTIYSQQREVIADIRTITDLGEQVAILETSVFNPARSRLTQSMSDAYYALSQLVATYCDKKNKAQAQQDLKSLMLDVSTAIDVTFNTVSEKTQQTLLEPTEPAHKKKKRKG